MAGKTNIGWASTTWNPYSGCTAVSPGCDNCYASELAERYRGGPAYPVGFDLMRRDTAFYAPTKWKKREFCFVNSMSDLFHRDIPTDDLRRIWDIMLEVDRHVYMILTKRAHRMEHIIRELELPLPSHIWLGVSVENQALADSRIPPLLRIPARGARWLSCEPLLGPLDLTEGMWCDCSIDGNHASCTGSVDWIVDGGESGGKRRPADPTWFRSIRDQCAAAGVPYFHKQGNNIHAGQDVVLDGETHTAFPSVVMPGGMPPLPKSDSTGLVKQGALI